MPRVMNYETHYLLVALRADKALKKRDVAGTVRLHLEREFGAHGPVRVSPADAPVRAVRAKPVVKKAVRSTSNDRRLAIAAAATKKTPARKKAAVRKTRKEA